MCNGHQCRHAHSVGVGDLLGLTGSRNATRNFITTFMSTPLHRLCCRTGRLAAKCALESREIYMFCSHRGSHCARLGGLLGACPASTRIFGICSEWLTSWLGCAASKGGARAHIAQFTPHFSQCNICVVFAHHCITRVYFTFRSGGPPPRPPADRFAPT